MPPGRLALLLTSTLLLLALAGVVWSPLLPRRERERYLADARASAASHDTSSHAAAEAQAARLGEDYGRLPLQFETNEGQTDPRVNFISRGNGYTLFLTPAEAVLRLRTADCGLRTAAGEVTCGPTNHGPETGDTRRGKPATLDTRTGLSAVLRMSLVGADVHAGVIGLEEQQGKSNYLIGRDPSKWHTNVSNYSRVRYTQIYPGVDLEYYGDHRQLEYDFRVASGANPEQIGLAFKGAKNLRIDKESGDLLVEIAGGELRQRKPVVYQEVNGKRRDVEGRYAMKGRGVVGFSIADYDHTQPLVIDPVLSYSTFIGTGRSLSVAVDSFGDAYVAGDTTATTFPTTTGVLQTTHGASSDAFVTKMNATGTSLIYSTFLGGDSDEQGNGIAVDAKGNAYVALQTDSDDLAVVNGFKNNQPVGDGYLAKLDPKGATLLYSTYVGGNDTDSANAVAVDSAGNAYVAGFAKSSDLLTSPAPASTFHNTLDGSQDAFLVKINTRATGAASFVYGTFLGGGGADDARSVAVDFAGRAVVCGVTNSSDFPLQSAAQDSLDGTSDGFVTKMNAAGTAPVFSTYLGGNGTDEADGVAVDAAGNSYVASETASTDFPTAGTPAQPAFGGGTFDIAVTKFTTAGAVSYSTFVGGSGNDLTPLNGSSCIAVDSHGDAVVTGETTSFNFPVVNASQSALSSGQDMFVTKLNPAGSQFIYSTYLGGNGQDTAAAVALDSFGNAYVVGDTFSANFPTTTGAFDTTSTGFDATVTKLSQLGSCDTVSYSDSTGSPFAVGSQPFSVAVGDFNNDGKQDFVAANSGTTTVSVLLGDGTGGFGAATNFNVGTSPTSVAVSDFNGDGKPDIAAANLGSNNVSILLGDGAGSFGAATNFNVGSGPQSLAVGDFNGDGKPDVATANFNTNDVSILLGDGTGGFSAATNFNVDSRPNFLAVGDFNLDGKLDLAVTDSTSNDVSILLGDGTGGFGAATNFPTNFNPQSVAVGDFNLDGKLDLAVGKASQVSVLLGDGTGSFGAETNFTTGGGGASVAVGDFNGDGKPDIATGNFSAANVSILPGNGAGSFGAATNFNAGTDPDSVAVGDFNGDGKPDLAVANFGSNNVSVLLDSCGLPTSNTIVVTNTNDSGAGSLRQAILDSNSTVGTKETITFNISGAGVHTISPTSALPDITDPVTIDGYTQPGASQNTLAVGNNAVLQIELNAAGESGNGLNILAGGSTVSGLVINRAGNAGIVLDTGGSNTVAGCFIGTDPAGATNLGNSSGGINIQSSPNNTIGGTSPAARNLISGNNNGINLNNSTNNVIRGNYIGTNAAGTAALGNADTGVFISVNSTGTVVGGASTGAGNLISGNNTFGIQITGSGSSGNQVKGNFIGTDAAGTAAVGNGSNAVHIFDAPNNTVGGVSAAERNVISGNGGSGVFIGNAGATGNIVRGNFIGTDATGASALANTGNGIVINAASSNTIGGTMTGEGNRIAFNGVSGVAIETTATNNSVLSNSIHDNTGLGIDLGSDGVTANDAGDADTGPNNLQNFPVLTGTTKFGANTKVTGTFNSTASTAFTLQFFSNATCDASGNGEGRTFLGSANVTTNGAGNASFNVTLPVAVAAGEVVTATATDPSNNTSEFSACSTASILGSCGTLSFATAANFGAGTGPQSVAVGDFNGDGKQDLAVANGSSNNVSVLLGNGAGSFSAATNFAVGTSPESVAVGDFNSDGKPDLVTANSGSDNVSVLLGNGAGSFGAATNFATGTHPIPVAVGDFNGDGKLDLVTADQTSNNVSVLLGDGAGNFGAPTDFAVGNTPASVAVGDFNGDGKLDLATGNEISNDVSVLLGNGAGGFAAATSFAVGATPQSVVAGDFNGDGKQDLATANQNTNDVSVLLGDGAGGFAAATSFAVGNVPQSVAVGDFNGDGKPDLAVANGFSNDVSILPGDGAGSFGAATNFNVGNFPNLVAVGDFNGDGKPDLVTANSGSDNVSVLLGNCVSSGLTLVVNSVGDGADNNPGDGVCNDGTGNCTLRAAIMEANATAGTDTITFNISGAGVHTIQPTSALPTITDPVTIDGYTQPGASANTLATGDNAVIDIELDGTNAGSTTSGLVITAGGSTVRGLVINRFGTGGTTSVTAGGTAIEMNTGDGNVVEGCFIGTNTTGASSLANINDGVGITSNNNRVGGATAAQRNVISGNDREGVLLLSFGANNIIEGNYIGTNAAGTAALTNASDIVLFDHANNCRIGGTNAGEGNLISGSLDTGVLIVNSSHDNTVQGNLIGTNATGTAAIPNQNNGVGVFDTTQNNTIGGNVAAARNVISGNTQNGVFLSSTGTGNVVEGNLIGTDINGTAAVANSQDGVAISGGTNITVGGTTAAARNVISGNAVSGVFILSSTTSSLNNVIVGNFIGTDVSGTADLGNTLDGVTLQSAVGNRVGGTTAGERNVISGNNRGGIFFDTNANSNLVEGNFIGTDVNGTSAIANSQTGVAAQESSNNTVGGTTAGAGNVISGNGGAGLEILGDNSDGTTVQGNIIGLNAAGTAALPNFQGLVIHGSADNTQVGGTTAAARNIISGNGNVGVIITDAGTTGNVVQGNFIGTDVNGTAAIGNTLNGITIGVTNGNTIGGTAAGAGNVISGNNAHGIALSGAANNNTVQGNFIGTNAAGTAAVGNSAHGIFVFDGDSNQIGGTAAGAGNVISGNTQDGVHIEPSAPGTTTSNGNLVQGNRIGTDASGVVALGNTGTGVNIVAGNNNAVGGTTAGAGNTIAFNTQVGVIVTSGGVNNSIQGNSIHDNGALGIDLGNNGVTANDTNDADTGSNNLQNFPVLISATSGSGNTVIQGTLNSTASTTFRVEFFVTPTCDASGNGEGKAFLGSTNVNTDASGNANINSTFGTTVAAGQVMTATATDPSNNTSEFSACKVIVAPSPTWTGAVSTDWNTAGNWSTNAVPTSADAVVIPSTGVTNEPTISSANAVAASVTVQSGRTLTVANNKTLTATTLAINTGATLHTLSNQTGFVNAAVTNNGTVDGVNANSLFDFLGSSFVNNGSVSVGFFRFGASQTLSGTGTFTSSTIEIISGSTVTLASDHTLSNLSVSDGTFNQGASFNLSVGPLTVSSLGTFKNLGTGDLTLAGNVSNGGTIQLNGGGGGCGDADSILIRSSVAGTQRAWTGAGTFSIIDVDVKDQAGTASINAQSSTDSGNNGANWHFAECAANNIQWLSGASGNWSDASKWQDGTGVNRVPAAGDDVTINTDGTYIVTLDVDATINSLTLGRATSPGTQTLDDPTHTLSLASASSILPTGIFNLGGTRRGVGTLAVSGTFNWTAGSLADAGATSIASAGHLNISSNSDKLLDTHTLDNAGIATWTGTGRILADDGALINNQSGGLFDCQNNSLFNYAGVGAIPTFNNLAGATLRKSVGGGQTTVGNFNFNNAGTLDVQTGNINFTSGGDTNTFNNGTLITGGGEVLLDSAHLSTNGTITVNGTFHLGGGQINFNTPTQGTWTGTGAFNWTSGSFHGTGTTNIAAGFHFNITGNSDKLLDTQTLDNTGIITLTGAGRLLGDDGAVINNQSGGLFDIQTDTGLAYGGVGPLATFNNLAGATFDKSAGGGNSNVSQFNFDNAGAFEIFSGTVVIDQGYTQTAGSTTLEGGNVSTGSNTIALQGGTLTGTGTVTAATLHNSGGTIAPGLSGPGCLSVSGNYTQGASGSLAIEVGGANPCSQFDRLAVTGTATLDGTLNTTLINGFTPTAGQSFQMMTYASETGAFASVTGPFAATVNATNVTITSNVAPSTFSVSGHVADPASLPLVGVNIHVSGSATRDVTTDAAGNYTFAGLPQGGSFTLTPSQTNFRFTPASANVNNLHDDVINVNFTGQFINHAITGHIVDAQGNPIPGVTVTLAGSFSAVTHTDAQGNFTFTNIPENGNFVVTPEKDGLVFNPAHQSVTGVVTDTQFQSVGSVQPSPTPTPDQSDDFSGGPDPDPDKWVRGILTNPPPAFDPLVNVFLAGGLLHIQPRADADGLHYGGLVSVRALDLNSTPIASVEVVQASTGAGAQTIFGLGRDSDNWFRFSVVADSAAPTPTPTPNATPTPTPNPSPTPHHSSAKTGAGGDTTTGQTLLFEINVGGRKFSVGIAYDPAQQRFWRFRNDAPAHQIVFETSPDAAVWTEHFRATLPTDQAQLIAELSAGTFRPTSAPGEALFDNFLLSPSPQLQFGNSDFNVLESAGMAQVQVIRTGSAESPDSVDFATSDGTAHAGRDYTSTSGTLVFGIGERVKTINIPVIDNSDPDGNRTVNITLSNPVGGRLGSIPRAVLTILDDDRPSNPIDDTTFFVTQQYLDFLGRAPDADGLAFWVRNIDSCGTDTQCREAKRVDTSAAFFLSIEFQETGYVVDRFYKATFGRPPTFDEYLPDLAALRDGVIIGQPGAEDRLAANKQLFAAQWVARPAFKQAYDKLNDEQYVDALSANAGVTLAEQDRTALVVGLLTKRETRATVLLKIVENEAFVESEFNPAFVRMEYFGYLRRDPDPAGFEFWLSKLERFDGDFRAAEMVKAFISSTEYRARFGQP